MCGDHASLNGDRPPGVNVPNVPAGVKYFGTFMCVAGSYTSITGVVAWRSRFIGPPPASLKHPFRFSGEVLGQYKRAAALALYVGPGNVAGIIASNVYRTEDSPRYILGRKS